MVGIEAARRPCLEIAEEFFRVRVASNADHDVDMVRHHR